MSTIKFQPTDPSTSHYMLPTSDAVQQLVNLGGVEEEIRRYGKDYSTVRFGGILVIFQEEAEQILNATIHPPVEEDDGWSLDDDEDDFDERTTVEYWMNWYKTDLLNEVLNYTDLPGDLDEINETTGRLGGGATKVRRMSKEELAEYLAEYHK